VLKYHLISTRTAGEAFWKTLDRQNNRTADRHIEWQ